MGHDQNRLSLAYRCLWLVLTIDTMVVGAYCGGVATWTGPPTARTLDVGTAIAVCGSAPGT